MESRHGAAYHGTVVPADETRTARWVAQLDARRRTLADEVEDDVAPVRHLTLHERGEWIASACRSAWDILRARPDARAVVEQIEAPAPDFATKWAALMARQRATPRA